MVCIVAAPIVNGNFIPHTPVMWTPPSYDDLMSRDAAVAVINTSMLRQAIVERSSKRRVETYAGRVASGHCELIGTAFT